MSKPTNLKELVAYLRDHPIVTCGERRLTFWAHRGGGLWFQDQTHSNVYLPINCGLAQSETGLEFLPDRFRMTKFGITHEYRYEDQS